MFPSTVIVKGETSPMFLFSESEFLAAKSRDKILRVKCESCEEIFLVSRYQVRKTQHSGDRVLKFCSRKCVGFANIVPKVTAPCNICGKLVTRRRKEIERYKSGNSGKIFCSRSCSATFTNKNKSYGFTRSKLEIWLEEQLRIHYPELEIHFNQKDAIGSELDIYFPGLKIAVELNGILHYIPIYGDHKLNQIRKNDSEKLASCNNEGISLCVIDISSMKHFTESKAKAYLDVIDQLICGRGGLNSHGTDYPFNGL